MKSSLNGPRRHGMPGWLAAVSAAGLLSFALPGITAAPALATDCANAAIRAEQGATAVPDCRAYELATNPFKEGFAPFWRGYTDDGVIAYTSAGNFANNGLGSTANRYVATRSDTGWVTASFNPSGPEYAGAPGGKELSADLRSSIWVMRRAEESSGVTDFYLQGGDGTFTHVGPSINPATAPAAPPGPNTVGSQPVFSGASADLSHLIFTENINQKFPGDATIGGGQSLYEYVGVGNTHPRLVGVDDNGDQISTCGTLAGSAPNTSAFHAISNDGRVIFFSPRPASVCGGTGPAAIEVWARADATPDDRDDPASMRSYKASASQCTRTAGDPGGVCNNAADATFQGAAADGSRVFFTTTQQLVDADTDATKDMYAYDLPTAAHPAGTLTEVSGAATGANVQGPGVVRISDDGSRVYFVATGVLAANHGANDAPAVANDKNLYVWEKDAAHPAGQTTFVGRLANNDTPLWGADSLGTGHMAQTTDDGRYLVLSTFSPLVSSGPDADNDTAQDIYRYDADTGAFARLSTSTSGDQGNGAGLNATITSVGFSTASPASRSHPVMTSDGRTVVFMSNEALSPDDTNGGVDIYEWRDGQVSMVSSGRPSEANPLGTFAWITSSGGDIYFATTERLTPDDGDTLVDIYDARVGGGFTFPAKPVCEPDTNCQPAPAPAPGVSVPSTTAPGPGEPVPDAAPSFSLQTVSAAQRKKLAATGKLTLTVTANTPGTLSAKATATIARKSVGVASARHTMAAPGTATLALKLSKKARAQLAASGKLTVKIAVSDSKVSVGQSATLKLTHAKAKKKASKHKKTKKSSGKRAAAGSKGARS